MAMKVLIVDDHESNRLLVKFLLESEGHACIEAEDGEIAVKQFIKHRPDFVLLDIVMPVMDGYEAAGHIKRHAGENHVPIIFLTAKHDEASLLKCLESGGDDYLPKPINGIILKAKIKAHARTQELTQQVQAKKIELSRLHAKLTQEHEMGRHVLTHTLKRSLQNCPNVQSYLSSMSTFNGDLFLLAENPAGGIYAFLGDFTGHGLAAAIGTIPVSQAFFSMCEKGMPVMDIVSSMNRSLKAFLPEYMFCAASLVHLSESGDQALIWTGGLPDAYLVRPGEGIVDTITSQNMPMGILNGDDFNNEAKIYELQRGDRLLLLTDGILEGMAKGSDIMFGEERVKSTVSCGRSDFLNDLLEAYHVFTGGEDQQDDISLVELIAEPYQTLHARAVQPKTDLPWRLECNLMAKQIQHQVDPIVKIMKLFPSDIFLFRRADMIRSVLSELYSNAVEHGLLELESSIKETAEGFAKYYEQRSQRVAALRNEHVKVTLDFDYQRVNRELYIKLEDSGKGFNYEAHNENLAENTRPWGRGIALVRSLSESVEYLNGGTCVEVFFSLTPNDKTRTHQQAGQA